MLGYVKRAIYLKLSRVNGISPIVPIRGIVNSSARVTPMILISLVQNWLLTGTQDIRSAAILLAKSRNYESKQKKRANSK